MSIAKRSVIATSLSFFLENSEKFGARQLLRNRATARSHCKEGPVMFDRVFLLSTSYRFVSGRRRGMLG